MDSASPGWHDDGMLRECLWRHAPFIPIWYHASSYAILVLMEEGLQQGQVKEGRCMSRLSIEVTPEQHQRLKAIAALHGQSIKEYVLARALPSLPALQDLSEEEALHRLEEFLQPRIEAAERGDVVNQSVTEIVEELKRERRAHKV